jgi:steroid delta-isomerase-like uncharacterized protein
MQAMQVVESYFDAWNRRDAEALIATFEEGGTYSDPAAGQGLAGQAIAAYAKSLWSGFPDLAFDIQSAGRTEQGVVAARWLMRGTNTGSFRGLPPTGRAVALAGVDFIEVKGDKIQSVQGYFDTRVVPEQLGLQVLIQPHTVGPFAFGTSTSVETGKKGKPGVFSITILYARSEEEIQKIKELSRQIATEMLEMPGFMGWVGMTTGTRMRTVTAWETPEHAQQLTRNSTHLEAMRKFFGPELASAATTGVWIPGRINTMWVRCPACSRMVDFAKSGGTCQCGESLTPMSYW